MGEPKPTDDLTDRLAGTAIRGSDSSNGHGYALELRTYYSAGDPPVIGGLLLCERWQTVRVQHVDGHAQLQGAVGSLPIVLPYGGLFSRKAAERGLLPYASVVALREHLRAILNASFFGGLCIQSRIVRVAWKESYEQTEEGVMDEADMFERNRPHAAPVSPRIPQQANPHG